MSYYDRCDRDFPSDHAYRRHIRDSPSHNLCDDCGTDFSSWRGLKEHWVQSPDHDYCQYCDEHFPAWSYLIDHYRNHHGYCETRNRIFKNENGLHEHNRQSHQDRYCVSCRRIFRSENNLNSHLNSSIHKPKDVKCPLCDMAFVSKSAVILHLESGSCQSGVNRQKVNQYVRQMDRSNVITNPSRLLTGGDDTTVDYIASERSWNGQAYECVLCHSRFAALLDLNRHLASPRHQDKIYKCPLGSCGIHFCTLSALCQHVESESCGIMKIQVVRHTLDNMLSGISRIGYY
ncbi:hypothetical protein F5J12DRAFT_856392 [Pisolithus orientalis]|uniref:uncharacterized protein n=1 Tax=Pisolithus orientalis TaxID=936130 RepID=UPI0022244A73|nr:uncharacterized protein F5J12DRAFT_856392 [Pisolithus orientalis]KAI5994886.1 hypothetical protein F5J12DRAFT_856392 [Pisolithus orientalis]